MSLSGSTPTAIEEEVLVAERKGERVGEGGGE
jgi:hypothetical protein